VYQSQLELFDYEVATRAHVGARYSELLAGVVPTPHIEPHNTSVFAQYTIEVDERDKVQAALKEAGIPTAVHYPVPLHRQPALAQDVRLSNSERAAQRVMSLPMHPYLTEAQQRRVAEAVVSAVSLRRP